MIKFAIVGLLCLLGTCRGQEALCICVDSKECVNGVASSDAVGRVIDYNTERCSGVRVCCKINERSERSSLRPSPPSYETPANNGPPREDGSQVELVDVPLLPIKNQQTGCGVRRTKDHRKPGDSLNERKGEEIQATTVKPGCEMKSNPNWPKVSKTQFRGINDENPDCKPKPNWPGVTTGQIRIIADEDEPVDTFYGELPWMVRVNVNGQFECGGTLIGHHAVLTAAHCVKGKQAADLTVDAGEWDTSTTKEPQKVQRREVHTVTSHGKFDSETGQHDVALLFTKEPFDFTETVDLICLGEKFQYLNQKDCYVAGWGKPTPKDPNYSTVLRKIPVPVLNNSHCQELFRETEAIGPQFVLLGGFVCVGGLDYKDTCKGDGGGPLFCSTKQDRDRFAVAGIISWGLECGKGYPTVVAGVPFYNKWIDHVSGDWRNNVLPTLGDRTRIY